MSFVIGADGAATRIETKLGCEPVDVATRIPDDLRR